jgi:NADPH:quinone reductase-like Zn-dependent oxidoreductase
MNKKNTNIMNANTMKAIVSTGYGSPEVLQFREVTKPAPKSDEILLRVHTSSATTADGMIRTGKPYFGRLLLGLTKPKHPIPGTGFAGEVESVGAAITQFKPGDRVFGETTLGFSTNAQYVVVPESGVICLMPDQLSYAEAAPFGDGALTSWNYLKHLANVRPGQRILINGASGSLGTAAVQLAKYLGAIVTGVCSTRNLGLVRSLGADEVIDYTRKDFTKGQQKYDIIFDTVGKSSFKACQAVLTEQGQYLCPVLNFSLLLDMLKSSIFGSRKAVFAATGMLSDEELRGMLAELVEIYKAGKLKMVIDRQYPLEKLAEAHTYIAAGRKKGNVVITSAD